PSPRSLFIFASHCYRAHPVLHPFPTRRSSDLELLPFREASFDFVFSRVALPYMHIPKAASEMGRVLKPGGGLWCLLHPLSRFSLDRKSTRLNSSHGSISYAVFCLKKKKNKSYV